MSRVFYDDGYMKLFLDSTSKVRFELRTELPLEDNVQFESLQEAELFAQSILNAVQFVKDGGEVNNELL